LAADYTGDSGNITTEARKVWVEAVTRTFPLPKIDFISECLYVKLILASGSLFLLSLLQHFPSHVILSPKMETDIAFMQVALDEARAAAAAGEVPIGAVLVHGGKILSRSGNRTIRDCDPTAHAEIIVIREAARLLGNYRMAGTTLYVTLEPCSMCAGAMIQARIPRLVYGADDPKGGAVRSCFEILTNVTLNHQVEVIPGLLAADCASVLQSFFAARR
jgi:tRNA(adenine34) deaminase